MTIMARNPFPRPRGGDPENEMLKQCLLDFSPPVRG